MNEYEDVIDGMEMAPEYAYFFILTGCTKLYNMACIWQGSQRTRKMRDTYRGGSHAKLVVGSTAHF
jgi:hypothetical protein